MTLDLYKHGLILSILVHAFDVLGDPVRRRILELLADHELTSGAVCALIQEEFGISQPGVSAHLRVLRDGGFATVRREGARRLYALNAEPLRNVDTWLDRFRRFWAPHLDALETELARGKRQRRLRANAHARPNERNVQSP
jgi:DNA-binding transcriptional ArsR family regulator